MFLVLCILILDDFGCLQFFLCWIPHCGVKTALSILDINSLWPSFCHHFANSPIYQPSNQAPSKRHISAQVRQFPSKRGLAAIQGQGSSARSRLATTFFPLVNFLEKMVCSNWCWIFSVEPCPFLEFSNPFGIGLNGFGNPKQHLGQSRWVIFGRTHLAKPEISGVTNGIRKIFLKGKNSWKICVRKCMWNYYMEIYWCKLVFEEALKLQKSSIPYLLFLSKCDTRLCCTWEVLHLPGDFSGSGTCRISGCDVERLGGRAATCGLSSSLPQIAWGISNSTMEPKIATTSWI